MGPAGVGAEAQLWWWQHKALKHWLSLATPVHFFPALVPIAGSVPIEQPGGGFSACESHKLSL